MTDAYRRNPSVNVATHPRPGQTSLAAAGEYSPPQATHRPSKREERRIVHGHAVVLDVAPDHRADIRAEFLKRLVQASPKLDFHGLQLRLHPRPPRPPEHREAALPGGRAAVRESQKVKALGFPLPAGSPVGRRLTTEFEEPRFLGMPRETEPRDSLTQRGQKLLSVVSRLESHDESGEFPLVRSLPASAPAVRSRTLVGGFSGTRKRSDFPGSSIIALRLVTSRCGRGVRHGKHGTSRFPGEMRPHVLGVSDRAGSASVWR